jgi:cysteine synthase A
MDLVAALDDEAVVRLMRLFNEPAGRRYLVEQGVDPALVGRLGLLGISGIGNILGCVKVAKHFELAERDILLTVATDSMALYGSRLEEERARRGEYSHTSAAVDHERRLLGAGTDSMEELTHASRRRIHNLKYFTWVEQQGKSTEELDAQWYDPAYWKREWSQVEEWDDRIRALNERVGARHG